MNDDIKEILYNPKIIMLSYGNFILLDDYIKLKDYITNLQQENQDLSRMCELYGKSLYNAELTDYKSRIDKAIKYKEEIDNSKCTFYTRGMFEDIIDILRGNNETN